MFESPCGSLSGTTEQLSILYKTRIRSILEFAAPVFHGGLTMEQSGKIEMCQKKALGVILGNQYNSYESALAILNLERLVHQTRRHVPQEHPDQTQHEKPKTLL